MALGVVAAGGVRLVAPDLAQHGAPQRRMMSGMRNSPPISMSSPRETMTSLPRREVSSASSTAAGVVVHHQRALGAGEPPQQRIHVAVAGAALLSARCPSRGSSSAAADHAQPLHRQRRQERAAQVRMQHHAGGVDHARERKGAGAGQAGPHHAREGRGIAGATGPAAAVAAARRRWRSRAIASRAAFARRACGRAASAGSPSSAVSTASRRAARGAAPGPPPRSRRRARRPTRPRQARLHALLHPRDHLVGLAAQRLRAHALGGYPGRSRRTASSVRAGPELVEVAGRKPLAAQGARPLAGQLGDEPVALERERGARA